MKHMATMKSFMPVIDMSLLTLFPHISKCYVYMYDLFNGSKLAVVSLLYSTSLPLIVEMT